LIKSTIVGEGHKKLRALANIYHTRGRRFDDKERIITQV